MSVYIEGRLQTRSYDKDGQKHYATDVVADRVVFLGGGGGAEWCRRGAAAAAAAVVAKGAGQPVDSKGILVRLTTARAGPPPDDDIPF